MYLSIITLNVNGRVYNDAAYKRFTLGQKTQTESEGVGKGCSCKGNDKKTGSHTHIRQNRLTHMP